MKDLMPPTDWHSVKDRVAALHRHPGHRKIFGATGHGMRLEAPLSAADLAAIEAAFGTTLPEDYREFLTVVGAGGAGPGYGVFPLRRNGDGGWRWEGDGADLTRPELLKEPFQTDRDRWGEMLDDVLGACPQEEEFATEEEWELAYEEWQPRVWAVFGEPGFSCGAICLVHYGCAQRGWLVVSGPARGHMWFDATCDDKDLEPMLHDDGRPITFADWYVTWLEESEEQAAQGR